MKKFLILAVTALLVIATLTGCKTAGVKAYGKEIINGGELGTFDYETLDDLKKEWKLTSGGTATDVFSIVENTEGANYLKINTTSSGYATVSQTLYLRTYSYYKITYTYTTSTMTNFKEDVGYIGLFAGFLENPDFNIKSDNATEERNSNNLGTAEFYFKTDSIREVNVALFVGTEDNPVSASNVTIRSFSLTRVEKAVAEAEGQTSGLYELTSTIYGAPTILNSVYVILGAIGTLIIGYAFYMWKARALALQLPDAKKNAFFEKLKSKKGLGLLIVLGGAFIVRLAILIAETVSSAPGAVQTVYYGYDLAKYGEFGNWLAKYGPPFFYKYFADAAFMPFTLYFSTLAGLIGRLIGLIPGVNEAGVLLATVTAFRLFAVLADAGTACLIYSILKKKAGAPSAVITALFYAMLPVFFLSSARVASADIFAVFFTVLAFRFLLDKNYLGMCAAYFSACMFSASALLAVPFILMYTAFIVYKSIKEKNKSWIMVLSAMVGALVLFYLVTLPFAIKYIPDGKPFYAFDSYIAAVKGADVYSVNAFNFQAMIGNNFKPVTTESTFVTILFIAFIIGLLAVAYFKGKNRLSLTLLGSAFVLVYWTFCNNVKPNTLLLALPLMLIYNGFVKDKRMFAAFTLFAASAFVNTSYVYMIAGYNDNGITQMGYDTPIMYIMGAVNLLLVIFFVVVGYDVLISRQSNEHLVLKVPYGTYVKSLATNSAIAVKNFGYKLSAFFSEVKESLKDERAERAAKRKVKKTEKTEKKDQ